MYSSNITFQHNPSYIFVLRLNLFYSIASICIKLTRSKHYNMLLKNKQNINNLLIKHMHTLTSINTLISSSSISQQYTVWQLVDTDKIMLSM